MVQRLLERMGSRRSGADEFAQILDLAASAESAPREPEKPAEPEIFWTEWRIDLMERLWGEGFLLPGGAAFVHELAKPLGLGAETSILVLGAGMGGPANLIAEQFGAFVDGIEPDYELAAASAKRAAFVKGISRVEIKNLAIDDDAAFDRHYDAIFGQEILLRCADKANLLKRCVNALKQNGKLVLTDLTSAADSNASAIAPWLEAEGTAGPLPSEDALRTLFKDAGFRVRAVEDMTDRYVRLVLDGWIALEESLRDNAANRAILLGMLAEAERWSRRVALLKSGHIKYTRVFAAKKTEF